MASLGAARAAKWPEMSVGDVRAGLDVCVCYRNAGSIRGTDGSWIAWQGEDRVSRRPVVPGLLRRRI